MKRLTGILIIAVALATAGCSNKELIAQKDAQIMELQGDVTRLEGQLEEQRRMTQDLNTQLADLQEQKRILIEEKDGLTHITLDGSATFGTAQADLTSEGMETIDRVWSVLQNYPDRRVLVEGHADDRQIASSYRHVYASNWELSSSRAHSVLHYIEGKYSLEPNRLAAVGYGEFMPVADNVTPEGRAQNRRVVITVGSKMDIERRMQEAPAISLQEQPVTE